MTFRDKLLFTVQSSSAGRMRTKTSAVRVPRRRDGPEGDPVSTTTEERDHPGLGVMGPPWGLLSSRLRRPLPRPNIVPRRDLMARLLDSSTPLIAVMAPAGYGKTTLLAQWSDADVRPSAWVSLGEDANDPTFLVRHLAAALSPVVPLDPDLVRELNSVRPRVSTVVLPRLGDAIRSAPEPFALVIDDVHLLTDPRGCQTILLLAEHLPAGSQFVLAGRNEAGGQLAKARARGQLFELGREDLRFSTEDAASLLQGAGAPPLDAAQLEALTARTEGWAVGLYLAALILHGRTAPVDDIETFGGNDRFVADYLREEVLTRLPPDDVDFMLRTSVLEELSGPICDAVLETGGSGAVLERLEASNLLVVPLDHTRERYRYHHLFRDLLRGELLRSDPNGAAALLDRASAWCEHHDLPDQAVAYAIANEDVDRVAELASRYAQAAYYGGRGETAEGWLTWLDRHAAIEGYPVAAALGAWLMALAGRHADAERWIDAATKGASAVEGEIEPRFEAMLETLHAAMCREGPERMRERAARALEILPGGDPWTATAILLAGASSLMLGDLDDAEARFANTADVAGQFGTAVAGSVAWAELALLALERGDVDDALGKVTRGRRILEEAGLQGYPMSALIYAVGARIAMVHGDPVGARRYMDEAESLRPLVTKAMPTVALQVRIQIARTAIGLRDEAATTSLREAEEILRSRPELGVLVDEVVSVSEDLRRMRAEGAETAALTPAEARLLPLLTTHLSFREIGEQLFISPHTVKTQAISIYRKLGVSSRSEAIEAARRLGLLTA